MVGWRRNVLISTLYTVTADTAVTLEHFYQFVKFMRDSHENVNVQERKKLFRFQVFTNIFYPFTLSLENKATLGTM